MLDRLAHDTARRLLAVWDGRPDASGLRFPELRGGGRRVSEQEARVVMCQALEGTDYSYSVECPTQTPYRFSGATQLSARTDLIVWDESERVLAVEFKAGQPPAAAISKDMQKLVTERVPGLWFHTLASADSRTLPALFAKLGDGLVHGRTTSPPGSDHRLTLAVVVLAGRERGLWTYATSVCDDVSADPADWTSQPLDSANARPL